MPIFQKLIYSSHPHEPKSISEELLRFNFVCFIWLRCLDFNGTRPDRMLLAGIEIKVLTVSCLNG